MKYITLLLAVALFSCENNQPKFKSAIKLQDTTSKKVHNYRDIYFSDEYIEVEVTRAKGGGYQDIYFNGADLSLADIKAKDTGRIGWKYQSGDTIKYQHPGKSWLKEDPKALFGDGIPANKNYPD